MPCGINRAPCPVQPRSVSFLSCAPYRGGLTRRSAPGDLCIAHTSALARIFDGTEEKSCAPISSVSPMDPPGVGGAQRQKSYTRSD